MIEAWVIWVPVVAAVFASLLTGAVTWGVTAWTRRQDERDDQDRMRRAAYLGLLQASTEVLLLGQRVHWTLRLRTGLRESLNVTLRYWKPVEPMDLIDLGLATLQRVLDAQTHVWSVGTQAGIDAADKVVEAASDFVQATTDNGSSGAATRLGLMPWRPTPTWRGPMRCTATIRTRRSGAYKPPRRRPARRMRTPRPRRLRCKPCAVKAACNSAPKSPPRSPARHGPRSWIIDMPWCAWR